MEDSTPAQRHYEAMKRAQKKYYDKNRDALLAKYKETHPNPRPRGRPRKVREGGVAEGGSPKGV